MPLHFHSILTRTSLFGTHLHIAAPIGFATFHASTWLVKSPNIVPSRDITAIIVLQGNMQPDDALQRYKERRVRDAQAPVGSTDFDDLDASDSDA